MIDIHLESKLHLPEEGPIALVEFFRIKAGHVIVEIDFRFANMSWRFSFEHQTTVMGIFWSIYIFVFSRRDATSGTWVIF